MGYTLDNAWQKARQRLSLLEECCDPATTRRLAALGVGPGWCCLEAGAGGGSIARWLSSRVGPAGRVTAVDIDVRFLPGPERKGVDEQLDAPTAGQEQNLEVRRLDLVAEELPRNAFDLVHARAVLQHLRERESVLEGLIAAVRPGGWLLVEESDRYPIAALATGLHARVMRAVIAGLTAAGMDLSFARSLPGRLQRSGLEGVGAEAETSLFEGGSGAAELLRLTVAQTRELALGAGATEEQLEAWNVLIAEPGQWFPGFALVAAWGRRSSSNRREA